MSYVAQIRTLHRLGKYYDIHLANPSDSFRPKVWSIMKFLYFFKKIKASRFKWEEIWDTKVFLEKQ